MEQTLGIASALGLLHGLLVGQEGGALGEEDRKGRQAKVLHGILGILAGAEVGKASHDLAQVGQVLLPGLEDLRLHPVSLRRASALRTFR